MKIQKTNFITINTPEGVSFPLYLAGPAIRSIAWFIDLFVILVLLNVVSMLIRFFGIVGVDFIQAMNFILYFLITTFYGILLEWYWDGQTLGKKVLGLQVVDVQGLKLQIHQVIIRNLLRVIDFVPFFYMVGGMASLISSHYQRLGDFAAQTLVIRNLKSGQPDLSQIRPDKYNSFCDYPHIVARLRNNILPEEAAMALKAIIRRESLNIKARQEIYTILVKHFKKIAPFPQEATDGISDERYLRNIVDVLYRTKNSTI